MREKTPVHIIYDGDCPFCRHFAGMVHLQEDYSAVVVNAREPHPLVAEATARDLDLDEGMIVILDDTFYHGDEAMTRMALMMSDNGWLRRLTIWVFASPRRSRIFYPPLRFCRNIVLKLLGHGKIDNIRGG